MSRIFTFTITDVLDESEVGLIHDTTGIQWDADENLTVTAPYQDITENITPHLHVLNCFRRGELYWAAPVYSVTYGQGIMSVFARSVDVRI